MNEKVFDRKQSKLKKWSAKFCRRNLKYFNLLIASYMVISF